MSEFLRCRDCKHDKGKCVGSSRRGSHKNCFEPREITNADCIRAMSDEELANFLDTIYDFFEDGGGKIVDGNVIYPDNMLDWLQHPAEGEEDT